MFDAFVVLAPIYLLGVIALLGFVGCQTIWGIDEDKSGEETEPTPESAPAAPTNLVAMAEDAAVTLNWDVVAGATEYHALRAETSGSVAADYPTEQVVQPDWLPWTDKGLVNGTTYYYRVTAVNSAGESDVSNEESATPTWPFGAFVTDVPTPGDTRQGPDGFYGMAIEIGALNLKIQTLGRYVDPQFDAPHEVRLIDGATNVELGHALVDMSSPMENNFRYAPIEPADPNISEIIVDAGGTYYVVSQEFTSGDAFYDQNTIVQTRTEATAVSAVYSDSPGLYVPVGGQNQSYGPVSFQY